MRKLAGLQPTDQLLLFEEVKPDMIEPLCLSDTFKTAELRNGGISGH